MEISKEKQIEEMAKCCIYHKDGRCTSEFQTPCDLMCNMFDFLANLEAAGYRKQSEWISVEERLPDCCGMPVLMVAVNEYEQI